MQNEEHMKHKRKVLMDLMGKMKEMQAGDLQNDHGNDSLSVNDSRPGRASEPSNSASVGKPNKQSNSGDSEEVHDDKSPRNASEPKNEESNEDSSPRSQREDAEHDDNNSSEESRESSHESSQRDLGGRGLFGHEESPDDEAEESSNIHPALAKLLAEHMKRK